MSDIEKTVNLSRQLVRRELWLRFSDVLKVMFPGLPRHIRRRQAWTWSSRYTAKTRQFGKIPTADQIYANVQEVLRRRKEAMNEHGA